MALAMKLAFWSGKDKAQMDRIFRSSGLFRDKWDTKHHADGTTYGEETLNRAIESTDSVYTSGGDNSIFEYEGKYFRSKGTISIDTTERWLDGEWWQDDENWKVLYWAEPIQLPVPQELMQRPRAGSL